VDASTSEAGSILSNHTYPTTYAASYRIELSIKIRFFRRSLLPGSPTIQLNTALREAAPDTEDHTDLLLSGDVEQNPGPDVDSLIAEDDDDLEA
jgi:hypothetical protein